MSDCEPTSLVALYSDSNAVVDIYRDGEESNAGAKNANTWSVDSGSTMVRLGSRSKSNTTQNSTQGWEGEVYTIRLYDRQLTATHTRFSTHPAAMRGSSIKARFPKDG